MLYAKFMTALAIEIAKDKSGLMEYDIFAIKNPEEVDGSVEMERAGTACTLESEERTYRFFESKMEELCSITEEEVFASAEKELEAYKAAQDMSNAMFGTDGSNPEDLCNRYPEVWDKVESMKYELRNESIYWETFADFARYGAIL